MDTLYKRFQEVVELGEEPDKVHRGPSSRTDIPSDPAQLRTELEHALHHIEKQKESYDSLLAESKGIESSLAKLRLQLESSRELWASTLRSQENTIELLIERSIYSSDQKSSSIDVDTTAGISSGTAADATYVESLKQQIDHLKDTIKRCSDERNTARLALRDQTARQVGGTQDPLTSSSSPAVEAAEETNVAVRKLTKFWDEERSSLEKQITELEAVCQKSADNVALLVQKHNAERERFTAANAAEQMDELVGANEQEDTMEAEVDKAPEPGTPAKGKKRDGASPVDHEMASQLADAREENQLLRAELESVKAQLEHANYECRAREDALNALYEDNRTWQSSIRSKEEEVAMYRDEADRQRRDLAHAQRLLASETDLRHTVETELGKLNEAHTRLQKSHASARESLSQALATQHLPAKGQTFQLQRTTEQRISSLETESKATADTASAGSGAAPNQFNKFISSATEKLRGANLQRGTIPQRVQKMMMLCAVVVLVMIFFMMHFARSDKRVSEEEFLLAIQQREGCKQELHTCLMSREKQHGV